MALSRTQEGDILFPWCHLSDTSPLVHSWALLPTSQSLPLRLVPSFTLAFSRSTQYTHRESPGCSAHLQDLVRVRLALALTRQAGPRDDLYLKQLPPWDLTGVEML